MGNSTTLYRFGPFELDERRFELRRDGQAIELQRKVLETILFLIKNRDRLVTKNDLIAGPWKGLAMSDATLSQTILSARRALADGTGRSTQIVTVRGKGFRFRPDVTVVGSASAALDGARDVEPAPATLRSGMPKRPFAGRTREIAQLREAERAARTGRGTVQLILGRPSSGKTSLIEHFAADCAGRGVRVVWGRCSAGAGVPPFWPWSEVIRGCSRRGLLTERKGDRAVPADLARLVPELGAAETPEPAGESPQVRFRLLEGIMRFLLEAAEQSPLVVALEDLHGGDEAALQVLDFLCRSIGNSALLVVATCRTLADSDDRPDLHALLSTTLPHVERLPLAPVSEEERLALGLPEEDGALWKRLERLPARTIELLEAAAVVGREFELAALSGSPDELTARLAPALDLGVIESAGTLAYRFARASVRETLYADLSPDRRAELHAGAAERFAARLREHPDLVFRVAHHVLAATPSHAGEDALVYVTCAAARAFEQCGYELAEELYRGALELCAAGSGLPSRRAELLLARARAQHFAGRTQAAEGTYRAALEWTRAHELGDAFVRGVLGWYDVLTVHATGHDAFHVELSRALALESPRSVRRAELLAIAAASSFKKPLAFRRTTLERAFAMAREADDSVAFTRLADALNHSHLHLPDAEGTLVLSAEIRRAAADTGQPQRALDALSLRAYSLLELGRGKEFIETLEEHARLARALRYPLHLWTADMLEAVRWQLEGKLEAAEALSRRAFVFGRTHVGPVAAACFGIERLAAALERRDPCRTEALAEARAVGGEGNGVTPGCRPWLIGRAVIDLELGHAEAAQRTLDRTIGAGLDELDEDRDRLPCLALLAHLACAIGDPSARHALIEALGPYRKLHVVTSSAYFAPVSLVLGKLWLSADEPKRAVAELESAIADSKKAGSLVAQCWAEYYFARALGPKNPKARTLLESARESARKLGLTRLEAAMAPAALSRSPASRP